MSQWVSQWVSDKGKQWSDSGPIKIMFTVPSLIPPLHMDPMWLYIKDYDKRCEESHCCNRKHFLLLALSKQHLYHLRPSLALGLAPTRLCTQSYFLQRAWLINATPVSVFSQNNITIPYHNSESGNPEVQIKWIWPENWLTEVLALLLRNIAQSHLLVTTWSKETFLDWQWVPIGFGK